MAYAPAASRNDLSGCSAFDGGVALGWIAWSATPRGVCELTFGHDSPQQAWDRLQASQNLTQTRAAQELNSAQPIGSDHAEWRELLERYAAGEPVDLTAIPLDPPPQTPFQQRVVRAVRELRFGEVASYAQIAARAGSPRAARAVGTVMARNPLPLLIPCHRVIGSGGRLGGYSAPQGLSMKQRLLEMERAR